MTTTFPYRSATPYERVKGYLDDTVSEADEYISEGEFTAGEFIEAFAQSLIESQKYFASKAQVYESLFAAIEAGRGSK